MLHLFMYLYVHNWDWNKNDFEYLGGAIAVASMRITLCDYALEHVLIKIFIYIIFIHILILNFVQWFN